jgi:D-xylose 1-dehydrogenase (NADP+, D-xylono-1,5-lactone-forming)
MSIRWGFLGAGSIATKALRPAVFDAQNASLYAVASRDVARSQSLEPEKIHTSYEDLLSDPDVDAVYISLANDQHCNWSIKALNAGKHVLCEKPIAMNANEARSMADATKANDRLLVEAVWTRWHPRFIRMVELVRNGAIGEIKAIDSSFTFPGSLEGNYRLIPEMGGGSLFDVGPYPLHAFSALTNGDLKLVVNSVNRNTSTTGVDMTTQIDATINSSIAAHALTSFEREEEQKLVVTGSLATIENVGNDAFTSLRSPSILKVGDSIEKFAPVDPYQLMVENFGSRILGEPSWILPMNETIRVMEILDEIAATKGGPVAP